MVTMEEPQMTKSQPGRESGQPQDITYRALRNTRWLAGTNGTQFLSH